MDISKITEYLYIGTQPKGLDYDILRELKIGLIVNMRAKHAPYSDFGKPPIKTVWIQTRDKIWAPIPTALLEYGAERALEVIRGGGRVFVHCAAGRHRSVAMAAAILIAMGYNAEQAIGTIKLQRLKADPRAWHIKRKIQKFETSWQRGNNKKKN